ncbi:MAG TPA: hypothetical protein VHP12_04440, partial [Chitinophagaceae bacterium]|nr:hypothetical protein [Chitinophagaceae bacterium]
LVLMNPPYAEATNAENKGDGSNSGNKTGVAKTKFTSFTKTKFGKASNELYTQFIARIAQEIPTATIAMFSTLKYVVSPTLEMFRNNWKAEYLNGFVVHSKAFDGLKGNFPIAFLIWKTNNIESAKGKAIEEITTDVLDKNATPIGEKLFFNSPNNRLLTNWIERPKINKAEAIPLKNAVVAATSTKDLRGLFWSDNAIGYMYCGVNDLQHAIQQTVIFSSTYGSGHGFFVNPNNLWQAAIVFSVRRLSKPTWLNDRDQFLQPTKPLTEEFKTDCLIWMLFNGSNLTASANGLEWNNKKWSIVNHFIPFTEEEVNAPERFESDFMQQYLSDKTISPEASTVLSEGKKLWQAFFAHTDVASVREELKLNRSDVGWYQIRKALQARNESGDYAPVNFKPFEEAYKTLTEKLQPQVYELGFLKA